MSALKQRHHDARAEARVLEDNPTCHICGKPCFSFGKPMYVETINVCGVHATGPAAVAYARIRASFA